MARTDFLSKDGNGVLRRIRSLVVGAEPTTAEAVHMPYQLVATAPYRVVGKERLALTNAGVTALTGASGAVSAVIAVDPEGAIRYQEDDTSPVTGTGAGMYVPAGGAFEVAPCDVADVTVLTQVKMIAVGTSVAVNVTYRAPF